MKDFLDKAINGKVCFGSAIFEIHFHFMSLFMTNHILGSYIVGAKSF